MAMLTTVLLIPLIALNVITEAMSYNQTRNLLEQIAISETAVRQMPDGAPPDGKRLQETTDAVPAARLGYFHGNYSYYHSQHHHYCGNYHRPDGTCSCGNQGGRKRCSGSGGSADTATHAPADSCSQGNDGSPKGNHCTADQGSCHDYQGGCFT